MEKDTRAPVLAVSPGAVAEREFDYYDLEPEGRIQPRDYFHTLLKRKWWVLIDSKNISK